MKIAVDGELALGAGSKDLMLCIIGTIGRFLWIVLSIVIAS